EVRCSIQLSYGRLSAFSEAKDRSAFYTAGRTTQNGVHVEWRRTSICSVRNQDGSRQAEQRGSTQRAKCSATIWPPALFASEKRTRGPAAEFGPLVGFGTTEWISAPPAVRVAFPRSAAACGRRRGRSATGTYAP